MSAVLVSIPYSPWSLRAKKALRAMGVPFALRTYTPVLSEPRVRWDLKRPFGTYTLPILLHDGPPLTDSLDIVRWGAGRSDAPLLDEAIDGACAHWSAVADRLMAAGRVRTTHRVLGDPDALYENLPAIVKPLGAFGRMIGRAEAHKLLRKYGDGSGPAAQVGRMRAALRTVSEALGDREVLLDRFSYADVAIAVALEFVKPHATHRVGPRSRICWTCDELASEFEPLIAWRDRVYAELADRRSADKG